MRKFNLWSLFFAALLSGCAGKQTLDNGAVNPLQTFKLEKEFAQFQERPLSDVAPVAAVDAPVVIEAKAEVKDVKAKREKLVAEKKKAPPAVAAAPASDTTPAPVEEAWQVGYPPELQALSDKHKDLWQHFRPVFDANESINLSVKFLGMKVGHFLLKVMPKVLVGSHQAYVFRGHLKSESYYEMLYKLDDVVESYVDVNLFVPIKFLMSQRESKKTQDELHLFDLDKLSYHFWYKRDKSGKVNENHVEGRLPRYFQDFLSSIYFLRGLPLELNKHYEFPSMNKGKLVISKAHVDSYETISIDGKNYETIKVRATNNFPGQKESRGDLEFWFAKDQKRTLLRLKGNVKIGNIEAEIVP